MDKAFKKQLMIQQTKNYDYIDEIQIPKVSGNIEIQQGGLQIKWYQVH